MLYTLEYHIMMIFVNTQDQTCVAPVSDMTPAF